MESLESIEEEYKGEMKHFEHILVDSESFAMCANGSGCLERAQSKPLHMSGF